MLLFICHFSCSFSYFIFRFGSCIPYTAGGINAQPNPCDKFFVTNVDNFYLPSGRARDNVRILNEFVFSTSSVIQRLSPDCR